MAGTVLGGQTLTPNPNVTASAGMGGDRWGANGGGITPIGNGVGGQTGWNSPVAQTLSDGETATTYITTPLPNASANVAIMCVSDESGSSAGGGASISTGQGIGSGGSPAVRAQRPNASAAAS